MSDITLNASMRSNLLSLQNTNKLLSLTQDRLSTGKRVNSVVDDPSAFFTARSLSDRASDLITVKDRLANNIETIKTATDALDSIEDLLKQAKAVGETAAASSSTTERATLLAQYNGILDQINNTAADASFNGIAMLKATSPDSLTVHLNENSTTLTVAGIASDQVGLAVTDALTGAAVADAWDHATLATGLIGINKDLALIDTALTTVRSSAKTLGTNSAMIQTRADFTGNLINALNKGSANLVNADLDAESANLLALQTRQALGIQALSISNQASQSILSLFR